MNEIRTLYPENVIIANEFEHWFSSFIDHIWDPEDKSYIGMAPSLENAFEAGYKAGMKHLDNYAFNPPPKEQKK